jgi:hypothetical protein
LYLGTPAPGEKESIRCKIISSSGARCPGECDVHAGGGIESGRQSAQFVPEIR